MEGQVVLLGVMPAKGMRQRDQLLLVLALVFIASYTDLDHDLDMEGMLLVVPLPLLQVDQLSLLPL